LTLGGVSAVSACYNCVLFIPLLVYRRATHAQLLGFQLETLPVVANVGNALTVIKMIM